MVFGALPGDKGLGLGTEGGIHGLRHVAVGLKAAGANAGAQSYQQIFRPGAVAPAHLRHGLAQNAVGYAPPAGVDRAYRAGEGVIEQRRAAVGGKHRQSQAGDIGDKGVGLIVPGPPQALSRVVRGDHQHVVAVDLIAEDRALVIGAYGVAEPAVVLLHRLLGVAPADPQIQGVEGRIADAALPGGKAVKYAGTSLQVRGSQPHQTVSFMGQKGHGSLPFAASAA